MSKILLVVTTYNESECTKLCFDSLKLLDEKFDVLVVDDCSTDNTIELCDEYGYDVITKKEGKGLTHSWNMAYEVFKNNDYDYFILANNDVLVPKGAIGELVKSFEKWPYSLIVPTSTTRGVGHNAQFQSMELFYNDFGFDCDNPENCQRTQDTMLEIKKQLTEQNNLYILDSVRMKMFNGFFFMMNRNIINYEYSDTELFKPEYVVTKNEDIFNWDNLIPNDDFPAICKTSFVFHYKAVTLKGDLRKNETWRKARFGNETN